MLLKSEIHELSAVWPRLIDRFHTLGTTQQTYLNSVGGIIEKRVYPRQVPTLKEDMCTSIDGAQAWQTANWKKGWAKIKETEERGSFLFASNTGSVFHKIELLPESKWNCFECILKVFSHRKVDLFKGLNKLNSHEKSKSPASKHAPVLLRMLDNAMDRNQHIQLTMPTSGGLIIRKTQFDSLTLRSNILSAFSDKSRVIIDLSKVQHLEVNRSTNKAMSTLYNQHGIPQLIIETN